MKHWHDVARQAADGSAPATEGHVIRWAGRYDLFVNAFTLGRMRVVRRTTIEVADIRPGTRVLDVGCGTGDLTLMAAARAGAHGEVVGIDASPDMIAVAREKATRKGASARFDVALIERIPFSDNYFDTIVSSLMLHHLPGDLKQQGLAEVYRVLRPGGRLLVVDIRNRPSGIARAILAASGHGSQQNQAGDLQSLLFQSGLADVSCGSMALGIFDYASGVKKPA